MSSALKIQAIRKRLRLNMNEFGELIGIDPSTISRYESGVVEPSRTVWMLLYLLSSEDERQPILESLGSVSDATLSRFQNAYEALKLLKPSDPVQTEFVEAAARIASKEKIEPTLLEVLRLYPNKKFRQALAHMLPYLEFVTNQKP